ncbi:MAG TPA: hypothetical protein VGZ29_06605 [Terriglobia bacterium]|nr:hypothetical protein [Terriglobia bacterium]
MRRIWLFSAPLVILLLAAGPVLTARQKKDKPPPTYDIPLPARPDFSPFAWLIGDWAGHATDPATGKETSGIVHLTISYVLDKRFLLFREEVSLPAGKMAPALHEVWTGFLNANPAGSGFVLRTFSSTGFISQYHVTVNDDHATFDPQGGANPPPGFLFRRTIARLGPGFFSEKVEVAPPGGAFFPYYGAKLTAVLEPKPAEPPAGSPPPASPAPPAH